MDAAKGPTGHGWPFGPGLWSNDGVREPAAGGPDAWGKTSWLLLGRLPEVTRRKGETNRKVNDSAAGKQAERASTISIAARNTPTKRCKVLLLRRLAYLVKRIK
jgi:hypothetical protein